MFVPFTGFSVMSCSLVERPCRACYLRLRPSIGTGTQSMWPHPAFLREAVVRLMLDRTIATAKQSGSRQLSLESGSSVALEPAILLYRLADFLEGSAIGDYRPNAFSRFFHLSL